MTNNQGWAVQDTKSGSYVATDGAIVLSTRKLARELRRSVAQDNLRVVPVKLNTIRNAPRA